MDDLILKEAEQRMKDCNHGVKFNKELCEEKNLSAKEVRTLFPRLDGPCPKKCGYCGIAYASYTHYLWGDW